MKGSVRAWHTVKCSRIAYGSYRVALAVLSPRLPSPYGLGFLPRSGSQ